MGRVLQMSKESSSSSSSSLFINIINRLEAHDYSDTKY